MGNNTYYLTYGRGEAGDHTIYGIGDTKEEAFEDSKNYGWTEELQEHDELYLFWVEITEALYNKLKTDGGNDLDDYVALNDGLLYDVQKLVLTGNYEEDMETIKGLADGTLWRDEDDITWEKGELLQGYLCAFDTTVFAGEYTQV